MRSAANITNLEELIKEITRIDNDLCELELENHAFDKVKRSGPKTNPRANSYKAQSY
jgi:hypothetical protein